MKKLTAISISLFLSLPSITLAQWSDHIKFDVSSPGVTLTNFQVLVQLNDSFFDYSKADSLGDDLRFSLDPTFSSGNGLNYWIEEFNSGGISEIWVNLPVIPASGDTSLYLFFGNSTAAVVSDGWATFELFDHFEGSSLISSVWKEFGYGSSSVQSSYVRFTQATNNWDFGIITDDIKHLSAFIIKAKYRLLDLDSRFNIQNSITNVEGNWHLRGGNNSEFDAEDHQIRVGRIDTSGKNTSEVEEDFTFTLNEWYKGESWFTGSQKITIQGDLKVMSDSNIYMNDYLGLAVYSSRDSTPRVDVDWVFVRKYHDVEINITPQIETSADNSLVLGSNEILIYPNPTNDFVNIEVMHQDPVDIRIIDQSGKVLREEKQLKDGIHRLELGDTKGLLVIEIICDGFVDRRKLLVR